MNHTQSFVLHCSLKYLFQHQLSLLRVEICLDGSDFFFTSSKQCYLQDSSENTTFLVCYCFLLFTVWIFCYNCDLTEKLHSFILLSFDRKIDVFLFTFWQHFFLVKTRFAVKIKREMHQFFCQMKEVWKKSIFLLNHSCNKKFKQ